MNRIQKIRIVVDCGMAVLMPLLMAYSLVGEAVHEWLGTAMAALSILHHILNRKWYRGLFKERHTGIRVLTVVTDLLLLANMIALPVSGIMMSRHVFTSLGIKAGLSFARTIHLLFSYWGLVLMSFHMGLHGAMIMGMFRRMVSIKSKSAARTIILRVIAALVGVGGIRAFFQRGILDYLFLQSQFAFFDFSQPLFLFLFDYTTVIFLFAALGYWVAECLRRHKLRGILL